MQQIKSSKVMGSASATVATQASDKLGSIGARYEREALNAIGAAIRAAGGSNAEVKVHASLKNVLDGTLTIGASWFNGKTRMVVAASQEILGGAMPLDAKAILATGVEQVHESIYASQKSYLVDPVKLRAKRVGDAVMLTHEALPEWSLRVTVGEIKASRETIEDRIASSIQSFCAGMLYRNADIPGGIKMPLVASETPAVPAMTEERKEAIHASLAEEQMRLTASMPTTREAGGGVDLQAGTSAQFEASESVKGSVRRAAASAAMSFMAKQVQGGSPSVKSIDLSGMTFSPSKIEGSALVSVETYGRISREETTVAVPFDATGKVVASGVGRPLADVMAAEDIRRKLEIASEMEAKAMFDKFVEEEKNKVAAGLSLEASSDMGYGSNWSKTGPALRIPISKTALPAEFSVIGKKILLGGMVYELQPTDYNAPSIERAAHWMLELRADLPASKADYAYSASGLGQAMSTVGL